MVRLHRRTGGVSGIYHCEIPDQSGVNQTLSVGLYSTSAQTSGKLEYYGITSVPSDEQCMGAVSDANITNTFLPDSIHVLPICYQ